MGIYRKYLLCAFSLLVILPVVTYAQVSRIVFTTDLQTIKPNELSGPITIQTQDSSGNSYKTPETIDLEFVSTSPTGEFLGSTGNPVTKTMSTNTSNRTFYYRDSGLGVFTLTVNAKGRTSGTAWSAGQIITISDSAPTTTTEATSTPKTSTSTSRATSNTSVVIISTHYSATPLTNTETDTEFEVGAGRSRMSTVGTPIEFNANTNASYTKNIDFKWSFGDGTTGSSQILTHTYAYPGEYIVVLNAASPDGIAVSRTNVSIVPANLSVTVAEFSRIEVMNNSSREMNLYGRALVVGSKIFKFPQDTIILPRQKINFATGTTGLEPRGIAGVYLMVVGNNLNNADIFAKIEEQRLEQIILVQTQISELQQKLAVMVRQEGNRQSLPTFEIKGPEEQTESQTALVANAISEARPSGISNWLEILKRFFLRTR